jgi:DUF971 family protein
MNHHIEPREDIVDQPKHIDIKRDRGVTIEWSDGVTSFYSVNYLRRMSPSAEQRQLLEEMQKNPLMVLPASALSKAGEPLTIEDAQFVGRYAIKLVFSDGHDTGIFSWDYLREIDPELEPRVE